MDSRTRDRHPARRREIYGYNSRQAASGGWQYPKSPVLVAVRPVLLDTFPKNNNIPGRQFTADVRTDSHTAVSERQLPLNNNSQSNDSGADSLSGLLVDAGLNGTDSESYLKHVYNSNYMDDRAENGGDIDFAKYNQTKLLEQSIIEMVEQSSLAAAENEAKLALGKAREAVKMFNTLENLAEQETKQSKLNVDESSPASPPMTTGARLFELSLMVNSNLAEQLQNANQLEESMDMYMQLCKLASSSEGFGYYAGSSSSHTQSDSKFLLYRFGLNIGNILYQMEEYQRALKYFRLTLDRISPTGYKNLKIKLMNNIAITLIKEAEQKSGKPATKDSLISLDVLVSDNLMELPSEHGQKESKIFVCNSNHHKFALNLLTCQYLLGDIRAMQETMKSFVQANICHQYRLALDYNANLNDDEIDSSRIMSRSMGVERLKHVRKDRIVNSSAHASMSSTKQLVRTSHGRQYSVNQLDDNNHDLDWSPGQEQRTTSAMGAYGSGRSQLRKIGNDQHENVRPRTSLTTSSSSNSDQSRASTQGASDRGGTTTDRQPITSRTLASDTDDMMRNRVLACIRRDSLEMMTRKQHELTSRALLVGCNLMMDLETSSRSAAIRQRATASQSTNKGSAFEFCFRLLSTSETSRHLINDLRIDRATKMLLSGNANQVQAALSTFKEIDSQIRGSTSSLSGQSSMVLSNLCFFNLLRNDYEAATEYAETSVRSSELNSDSLTNLANCYYFRNDLRAAKTIYRRAITINPLSRQASYNLAIVNRKLGLGLNELDESARVWLNSKSSEFISKSSVQSTGRRVLALPAVQSALLQRNGPTNEAENSANSSELASLIARTSQSPELYLIATETAKSDEAAMKILQKSNNEHPYHLPTLERLVALHIKAHNYQGAKRLLLDCIKIRPDQSRWYQILAECCRRSAEYDQAISLLKVAIDLFPRDAGCLRALVKITDELGIKNETYRLRLGKLEGINIS